LQNLKPPAHKLVGTNWSAGDLAREKTAAGSLPLQGMAAWAAIDHGSTQDSMVAPTE